MGWSAGGRRGDLRATDDDREGVMRLLDVAGQEGRLNSVEHARRADVVYASKTCGELAALTTDLPNQRGVRQWIDEVLVRGDDRERAMGWLAEAAAQGRLSTVEYEERVSTLSEAATYAQLKRVLDGVPGGPHGSATEPLAGIADREAALASLAEAVADGRVRLAECAGFEAEIRQARRVSDLHALRARLGARASDQERHRAIREVEAAYLAGQLDAGERAVRVDRAQTAARDDDLADLVHDLRGPTRRLAKADREEAATRLRDRRVTS